MAPTRKPKISPSHARGKMPATHHARPPDVEHANELFRVRDKHEYEDQPGKLWGENLTYADATKLKNEVCGTRKSRTARLEPMSVAMPEGEPARARALPKGDLASSPPRRRFPRADVPVVEGATPPVPLSLAIAAGQRSAADAQRRADAVAADKKRQADLAELALSVGAEDGSEEDDFDASDVNDMTDGLEAMPTQADLARAERNAQQKPHSA